MEIRNHLFILKIRNSAGREFVKYSLVGFSGFLLNLVVLYILTEFVGVYYLLSAIVAGICMGTYNFSLDKVWIFKEKLGTRFLDEYMHFALIGGTGILIGLGILYLLTNVAGLYYVFAQAITLGGMGFFTFTFNEIYTFRSRRKKSIELNSRV